MNINTKQDRPPAFRTAITLIRVMGIVVENPRKVGTHEIQEKLKLVGVELTLRSIQRHLHILKDNGVPIDCDGHSPQGWFAKKHRTEEEKEMLDMTRVFVRRSA